MSATIHQHPAATPPPGGPSGPATVETPAPFSNPVTAKCADAAIAAFNAANRAERSLYAAEYALDEVNRAAKLVDQARKQLTATIRELREAQPVLNAMAYAFMERMPKA